MTSRTDLDAALEAFDAAGADRAARDRACESALDRARAMFAAWFLAGAGREIVWIAGADPAQAEAVGPPAIVAEVRVVFKRLRLPWQRADPSNVVLVAGTCPDDPLLDLGLRDDKLILWAGAWLVWYMETSGDAAVDTLPEPPKLPELCRRAGLRLRASPKLQTELKQAHRKLAALEHAVSMLEEPKPCA